MGRVAQLLHQVELPVDIGLHRASLPARDACSSIKPFPVHPQTSKMGQELTKADTLALGQLRVKPK